MENIIIFIGTAIASFLFTFLLFRNLLPVGAESNMILGFIVFIVGEIAVCTNIIVKRIDALKDKAMD